ncbi:MAG: alcohol dehydrogenase [Gammaproteobacteria bacterium]|nr:alcohol dehydrogenase [Gammaproteobacteria bacterium]
MKRFLTLAAIVVVLGAVALSMLNRADGSAGTAPSIAGAPASAAVLARGEYLAKAADCIACHTVPESGRPFAGGVAFKLPFGTMYSSNITPDPVHGIGGWSDDEFVRAVRDGIGKDGQHLYPSFPYTSYTALSRDDVLAIKAYLQSQPAIRQANRANDLGFPFNQRWAMSFWNAVFFKDRRFVADASKSPEWNSGAYLATALGHCGECHTPRNLGFGLEHGKELAGEELQGWRAYNITPDPNYGIGAWSDAEIARYLKTGFAEGHASASGPMGEAVSHSLQFLNAEDITALVTYLRSVPARQGKDRVAVDHQPAPSLASSDIAPAGGDVPAHAQGLKLFEGACASCHQWNGKGQQSQYAALLGTRGVNDVSGTNVTQAILQGAKMRVGDSDVFMPAFGGAYSNAEVAALANYVIAHFGGKQGEVTPDLVAKRRTR